ncbi:MAG TPA: hypothetical protein VFR92_05220 [Sphingomicrobium sp.]|jgi:guanyl-specific ribonuclease Sa|nr:hypothetical protein [Sphingomicrobium sp.]
MITQRFAVEFDRRTVGIAVRVPGGFMFYASDNRFDAMDGQLFRRARAIERALTRQAKGEGSRGARRQLAFAA